MSFIIYVARDLVQLKHMARVIFVMSLWLYVDFESPQLFHLDGLQMLLNISIACWYFSLVDNPIKYKF